jgi:ketosteroid isomerase-like protein
VSEDQRIALIQRAFRDFEERDVDGLIAFLDPEVRSRVHPPLMNAGEWHGFEGFAQMTAGWEEAFGEITYALGEIELPDERHALIAVHQSATGAGSGVPVELDVYFLIEFEGERAVRFEIHASRDSALGHV